MWKLENRRDTWGILMVGGRVPVARWGSAVCNVGHRVFVHGGYSLAKTHPNLRDRNEESSGAALDEFRVPPRRRHTRGAILKFGREVF